MSLAPDRSYIEIIIGIGDLEQTVYFDVKDNELIDIEICAYEQRLENQDRVKEQHFTYIPSPTNKE